RSPCRTGSPTRTRAPRSARSARRSTGCSATSRRGRAAGRPGRRGRAGSPPAPGAGCRPRRPPPAPWAGFARSNPAPPAGACATPGDRAPARAREESGSARMGVLVDELWPPAQHDGGGLLAKDPVDLARLAADTARVARAASPGHRWALERPDEPVLVEGDEH